MMRGALTAIRAVTLLGIVACTSPASQPQTTQATATVVSPPPRCSDTICRVGDDPAIYVSSPDSPGETVPIKGRLKWVASESCLLLDITSGRDAGVVVPMWPPGTASTRTAGDKRGVVVPEAG